MAGCIGRRAGLHDVAMVEGLWRRQEGMLERGEWIDGPWQPVQSGMAEAVGESAAEVQASLGKVKVFSANHLLLFWLGLTNVLAFLLFASDKFKSGGSGGNRINEFNLAAIGAVGGWPGGLLAMLLFRHKTAKPSFKLKYGIAFLVWAGLIYAAVLFLHH